jgi:DNA-binding XRE family transcriptional regulator
MANHKLIACHATRAGGHRPASRALQLAEAMGVSRQTINSIENERYTPSLPLALALARYFGVTVEEMFDDQGL